MAVLNNPVNISIIIPVFFITQIFPKLDFRQLLVMIKNDIKNKIFFIVSNATTTSLIMNRTMFYRNYIN